MSSMADDIDEQVKAGRKTVAMATEDAEEMEPRLEPRRVPTAVIAAGVGAAVVGLGLLGWLIYRNRRKRNLVEQLQATLPGHITDLRERGVQRLGDLREIGMERMGDARLLRDEVRKRLAKVR